MTGPELIFTELNSHKIRDNMVLLVHILGLYCLSHIYLFILPSSKSAFFFGVMASTFSRFKDIFNVVIYGCI